MKELTHLDKYLLAPNLSFYGGLIYDGEDIKLCNDHDVDKDYDFKVKQVIRHDVMYTDIEKEYKIKGKTIKEESHMSMEIEKGTLLVYVQGLGFTIPEYHMITPSEAIKQFQILRGDADDIDGNAEESAETNRRD